MYLVIFERYVGGDGFRGRAIIFENTWERRIIILNVSALIGYEKKKWFGLKSMCIFKGKKFSGIFLPLDGSDAIITRPRNIITALD